MLEAIHKKIDEPERGTLEKTQGFLWATDADLRLILTTSLAKPSPQKQMAVDFEGKSQNHFSRWLELIHVDDLECVQAHVEAHLRGKAENICLEHRLLFRDGVVRWVLVQAQAIRHRRGAAKQLVGTLTDTTGRKNTEKLLRIERDLSVMLCSAGNWATALREVIDAVCKIDAVDCGGVYLHDSQTRDLNSSYKKACRRIMRRRFPR